MKKIELLCFGKQKFRDLVELEKKYLKKINFFIDCTITNLKETKTQNESQAREKQGIKILEHLKEKDFVIAFDQSGEKMDSRGFARIISEKVTYTPGRIVFLIGGPSGLSKNLENRIDSRISFSDMTIAHDIFRIVFLEQLYRAFTIIKGTKYHR